MVLRHRKRDYWVINCHHMGEKNDKATDKNHCVIIGSLFSVFFLFCVPVVY